MGQSDRCCVKGCKSRRSSTTTNHSYFKFPAGPPERRKAWIIFSGRKKAIRITWKICSQHFITGKPSQGPKAKDYIPTLHGAKRKRRYGKSDGSAADVGEQTVLTSGVNGVNCFQSDDAHFSSEDHLESQDHLGPRDRLDYSDHLKPQNKASTCEWDLCKQSESNLSDVEAISDLDSEGGLSVSSTSSSSSDEEDIFEKTKGICPICGKEFPLAKELKIHVRRHTQSAGKRTSKGEVKVVCTCSVCGKQLGSKSSLSAHIAGVHGQYRHYICDFCGQKFAGASGLKAHRLKHSGERPFVCQTCGKGFRKKIMLGNHELRVHNIQTKQDVFPCPVCGMKFLIKSRMKFHMEKHEDRVHECKFCGKKFRYIGNLKTHMKGVHEGDAKYECNHCQKRFGNAYNLKVHMRTHTGEKPYYCSVCAKGFADVCNYRRHQLKCFQGAPAFTEELDQNLKEKSASLLPSSQMGVPQIFPSYAASDLSATAQSYQLNNNNMDVYGIKQVYQQATESDRHRYNQNWLTSLGSVQLVQCDTTQKSDDQELFCHTHKVQAPQVFVQAEGTTHYTGLDGAHVQDRPHTGLDGAHVQDRHHTGLDGVHVQDRAYIGSDAVHGLDLTHDLDTSHSLATLNGQRVNISAVVGSYDVNSHSNVLGQQRSAQSPSTELMALSPMECTTIGPYSIPSTAESYGVAQNINSSLSESVQLLPNRTQHTALSGPCHKLKLNSSQHKELEGLGLVQMAHIPRNIAQTMRNSVHDSAHLVPQSKNLNNMPQNSLHTPSVYQGSADNCQPITRFTQQHSPLDIRVTETNIPTNNIPENNIPGSDPDADEGSDCDNLMDPEDLDSDILDLRATKSAVQTTDTMDEAQSRWHSAFTQFFDPSKMDPKEFAQAANIYNYFPKP